MPITCKICSTEFEKIIPWQHLKTHGISTSEYKEKYGPVYSAETLSKFQSRVPHNKGKKVTNPAQLERIRAAIARREEKFKQGEFVRGTPCTEERRKKLSEASKSYAALNPDKMKERAEKAVKTRTERGYDFGSNMRGKKHTAETRALISKKNQERYSTFVSEGSIRTSKRIEAENLTLLSSIKQNTLELKCNSCDTSFTLTRQQFRDSKYKGNTCPVCFPRQQGKHSVGELELYNFVKSLQPDTVHGYRRTYHSKEIDVFVPKLQIGFEYNGLYWHSEQLFQSINKSHIADALKWLYFKQQGVTLIQIFEDEWSLKSQIVQSKITHLLEKTPRKIHARLCRVIQISQQSAHCFLEVNSLGGLHACDYWFSLEHCSETVSVIGFDIENEHCKILNFAIKCFAHIPGAFSKLLNVAKQRYNAKEIRIVSDNRWHSSKSFIACGFEATEKIKPQCWYFKANFTGRKCAPEPGFGNTIWDSGYTEYCWKKL